MGTSTVVRSPGQPSMVRRRVTILVLPTMAVLAGSMVFGPRGGTVAAQKASELQSLGILSGTATAGKPFTAAQVYLHSSDKRRQMEYMVYTQAGGVKAVAVLPGNYERTVSAGGLESDPQPIVVKGGNNPAVKVAMHDAKDPIQYPSSVDPSLARTGNGALPPKQE